MNSPASSSALEAIEEIGAPVSVRIDELLVAEIERWSLLDPSIAEPLLSLRRLVAAGGKRLRPAFAYWAFVAAGGKRQDPAMVEIGAALELLHSFALVHDDVMDDSLQRRGSDAVHVEFLKRHATAQWKGEHRRFGEGVAILVGDMAFVYADRLMGTANPEVRNLFTEMRVELNVGQFLDVSATVRSDVSEKMSNTIARYKSGKYTVERPMHLGAAMAGQFDELQAAFTGYGIPVGEAFQFRDDILGAFGDAAITGKPVGGDLIEGKPTALLAMARETATGAAKNLLEDRYGALDITTDEVRQLQEVLVETGARKRLDERIDRLVEEGLGALDSADIESDAKLRLTDLAYFVAGREH